MKTDRHRLSDRKKKEIFERLEQCLHSEMSGLLAAYVFGSFTAGNDFGDIDLALLMDTAISDSLELELSAENSLGQLLHLPVDVRVLNRAPLSFQYRVIREGRLVLDSDPNRRADFEGQVLKRYFDFSRFRKRYLKEVAHAPL